MANNLKTVFQRLDQAITGNWEVPQATTPLAPSTQSGDVIYTTTDKSAYEKTKLEYQQNNYLNQRWLKANHDMSVQAFNGLNNVKLMYRDADLMDSFPEIGAALDIISEESTCLSPKGCRTDHPPWRAAVCRDAAGFPGRYQYPPRRPAGRCPGTRARYPAGTAWPKHPPPREYRSRSGRRPAQPAP